MKLSGQIEPATQEKYNILGKRQIEEKQKFFSRICVNSNSWEVTVIEYLCHASGCQEVACEL